MDNKYNEENQLPGENQPINQQINHQPNQQTGDPPINTPNKRPWYNQGWVWLIVALIGIVVLYLGFSWVTEEVANVNQSVQEQTDVLKEQNNILHNIKDGIVAIKDAVLNLFQSNDSSNS